MEFVAAKCPNCAGELRLPDDRAEAKCLYCGFDILVREAISQAGPSVANLKKLALAAESDRNNDEAYEYFKRVLEFEPDNFEALVGKAIAAENLYNFNYETLSNEGPSQSLDAVERAIKSASDELRTFRIEHAAGRIAKFCPRALKVAYGLDPHNEEVLIALYRSSRDLADLYIENEYSLSNFDENYAEHSEEAETWLRELRSVNPELADEIENEANERSAPIHAKRTEHDNKRKAADDEWRSSQQAQSIIIVIVAVVLVIAAIICCRGGR